jgi:hypothetical protein
MLRRAFTTKYQNISRNIKNEHPYSCWIRKVFNTKQNEKICTQSTFYNGWNDTLRFIEEKYPMSASEKEEKMREIPFIPEPGCKQVVLGTMELIAPYFYYNQMQHQNNEEEPFILLASQHWSEDLNIAYVSCAMSLLLGNQSCVYPIRLLLPKDNYKLLSANRSKPRVTLYELCILFQYSKYFNTEEFDRGDYTIFLFKPNKNANIFKRNMNGGKRRKTRRHRK